MVEKGISHNGTVKAIIGNRLFVDIVQISACSSCQAQKLCRVSEMKEKTVEVTVADPEKYKVGQTVKVFGSSSQGLKAVLLAFGVPLVLTILILVASMSIWNNEKTAVLMGLAVLLVYWTILFLCRDKVGREFSFGISD